MAETSTNLANLSAGRVDTLFTSATLTGGASAGYLTWTLGLLLAGALVLGMRRGVLVFAVAHVGATLATVGMLALDAMPGVDADAVRTMSDVGPSYGTVGVVTAALVLLAPGARAATLAGGSVLAVMAALLVGDPDVATWGHLLAAGLALPLGLWLRSSPSLLTPELPETTA